MKEIILKSLKIENFKGCANAQIDFEQTTDIYGANAAGKTTVFDAFTWLLFDKDSTRNSKFNVRPLDSDGNRIDNIEILVEAILEVDGQSMVLQKVQKQNWVKKRGTDVTELQGNTNIYEVDSFPASEKEFKEKVASIVSEDLFKMLTDPKSFAVLPWKKQREILLRFISEITDADVLEKSSEDYAPIEEELQAAPVEKCIEKAKKAMSKMKDRQKELPARIDEASKSLVEVPGLAEMELQRNSFNEQLKEVQARRDDSSKSSDAVDIIQSKILQVQSKIRIADDTAARVQADKKRELREKHDSLQRDTYRLLNERRNREDELKTVQIRIGELSAEKAELAKKWKEAKARAMNEDDTLCEKCGQILPADRIGEIRANFEAMKERKIVSITEKGRGVKTKIEKFETRVTDLEKEIVALRERWNEAAQKSSKAYEEMTAPVKPVDLSESQEYMALQQELEELKKQLSGMDTGEGLRKQLSAEEDNIRQQLDEVNRKFAAADSNDRTNDRITELQDEQKEIGQKVADQEQKIYLLEKFSREKMDMLASGINAQFNVVNFKLFDQQINGGIKDACEMMIDGVPYSSLNSAARMQAGLDVINALSRLYQVSVPVWLDNRESVTDIPDVSSQVINLIVSPADTTLRIGGI